MKLSVKLHDQLTPPQQDFLASREPHGLLTGPPGTAKTYTACAKGLTLLQKRKHDRIILIRSAVATRPLGFLPGDIYEKQEVFAEPYIQIFKDLTGMKNGWSALDRANLVEFTTTSHLRGMTFDDAVIILDEIQNFSYHEARTAATRLGKNSVLYVCGDSGQSDLDADKDGHKRFNRIFTSMDGVHCVQFTSDDIVRSGFVQDFCEAEAADATAQKRAPVKWATKAQANGEVIEHIF